MAAIGGDIHNYQHYHVEVDPLVPPEAGGKTLTKPPLRRRSIEYLVSGGGGAYLSATHRIGKVAMTSSGRNRLPSGVGPVGEDHFCCYPLRGDSLALFTRRFGAALSRGFLVVWPLMIAFVLCSDRWLWDLHISMDGMPDAGPVARAALIYVVVLVSVIAIGTIVGTRVSRAVRALVSVPTTGMLRLAGIVALCALAAFTVELIWQPWHWLWRVVAVTSVVLVGPLSLVVLNYFGRERGPAVMRDLLLAAVPAAAAILLVVKPDDFGEISATVTAAAAAIAALALCSAIVRRAAKRWYPRVLSVLAFAFFVVALTVLVSEHQWYAEIAVASIAALVTLLVGLTAIVAWPAVFMMPIFVRGSMDPDEAVEQYKRRSGAPRERPVKGSVSLKTRAQSTLLLGPVFGKMLNLFVSEIAEATAPPFFKSFLTVDTTADKLVIRCWGVSGFADQEEAPTLEDEFEIDLREP